MQEIRQLLNEYQDLPEYLQFCDLSDLLLLKPGAQKIELKQAIEGAMNRYRTDSIYFSATEEPFVDFRTGKILDPGSILYKQDSFFLVIRQLDENSPFESNLYYLDGRQCHYKRIKIDDSCTLPIPNRQPLSNECFKVLDKKEMKPQKQQIDSLYNYLIDSGFYCFPGRFKSCVDGEVLTVYFKTKDRYKISQVHSPEDLHPLKVIFSKVKKLLEDQIVVKRNF